jgi:hypothetical protein
VATRLLERIPAWYWQVPYVGSHYPGAVDRARLRDGGNCQLFAYEVLGLFGFDIPDLRSDQLWLDASTTVTVTEPQPFDLVLFNSVDEPRGAHVGVVMGENEVVHLCAEVGRPAVWNFDDFRRRARYQCLVGIKRPTLSRPQRLRSRALGLAPGDGPIKSDPL